VNGISFLEVTSKLSVPRTSIVSFVFMLHLPPVSPQIITDGMNIWRPSNVQCTKIIPQYINTEYSIGAQHPAVEVRTAFVVIIIILHGELGVILMISCNVPIKLLTASSSLYTS
jgi:hypothetical protein